MDPITPRHCKALCDVATSFADSPPGGLFAKWFYGVLLPVGLWVYGASCCSAMQVDWGQIPLKGISAVAYGIVWISIASFMHFHYFWGNVERLCGLSELGKMLAASSLGISLVYLLYRIAMFQ